MKKILTLLFMVVIFVAGLYMSSCQKCASCQYTYTNANGETETYRYTQVCGNSGDVNDYKDACVQAAATFTNGACTCVDE